MEFTESKSLKIPQELRERNQWIVWKYGAVRKNGKREKVPYYPTSGERADTAKLETWGTFEEAVVAVGDGIGYVFSESGPYTGIDLDNCRDKATGAIKPWAINHVYQLDSYTELSPSGTGFHVIVRAKKPGIRCKKGDIEIYDRTHFFTFTGKHVDGTPTTIEDRQAEVSALYAFTFREDEVETNQELPTPPNRWTDAELLERAMRRQQFQRLWLGDRSEYLNGDESAADLALCRYLAFWTGRDKERIDRLFRQSGLMRAKWERASYRNKTIVKAIHSTQQTYTGTATPEQAEEHETHDVVQSQTDAQREKQLKAIAKELETAIRQARKQMSSRITVANQPPGAGKTHVVAALGRPTPAFPLGKLNIGLVVERKNQLRQKMPEGRGLFDGWHKQEGCTPENCPEGYELHIALAERGYKTAGVHKAHNCAYWQQMQRDGSTGYQVEHVGTSYIREHDVYIIDEFNLSKWIPARYFMVSDLHAAARRYGYTADENLLLSAVASVVGSVGEPLQGKPLFDAVNVRCGGKLAEIVTGLYTNDNLMEARPWADVDALAEVEKLPPVIVPTLVRVMYTELAKWQTGHDWNSHLRTAQQVKGDGENEPGWKLCISERRRFLREPQAIVVMDATADQRIQRQFWGRDVRMLRACGEPARGTQHIQVRTGKRYRKTGLTTADNKEKNKDRLIREVRYVLRTYCPNGPVGLISFKDIKDEIGDALETDQRLNFWGQRGSNELCDVDVLVVAGTPVWNPQDIARMGRVLYSEDATPIDERFEDGRFVDERLQHISEHITHSELTQAAHRSRALRYPNKTIVTLCEGEIDYLPPTVTVTRLGRLTKDGRLQRDASSPDVHLCAAERRLVEQGIPVNGRTLAKEARVRKMTAYAWLKSREERKVA